MTRRDTQCLSLLTKKGEKKGVKFELEKKITVRMQMRGGNGGRRRRNHSCPKISGSEMSCPIHRRPFVLGIGLNRLIPRLEEGGRRLPRLSGHVNSTSVTGIPPPLQAPTGRTRRHAHRSRFRVLYQKKPGDFPPIPSSPPPLLTQKVNPKCIFILLGEEQGSDGFFTADFRSLFVAAFRFPFCSNKFAGANWDYSTRKMSFEARYIFPSTTCPFFCLSFFLEGAGAVKFLFLGPREKKCQCLSSRFSTPTTPRGGLNTCQGKRLERDSPNIRIKNQSL